MTAAKRPPAAKRGAATNQVITVARFEQAMLLLEELVDENTDLFIGKMQAFKEKHRAGTDRPLSAEEAAQVAAALSAAIEEDEADAVSLAERVQSSGLRAYDQPNGREVLLSAGVSTAPAFINAALRLVALIEVPQAEFEAAYDSDSLDEAIAERVKALRQLDLEVARKRAAAALDLLAEKSGAGGGKGLSSLIQVVWRALNQAAETATPSPESLASSALMGSLEPTVGAEESAFTASL
jgi:hypothetical protein